MGITSSRHRFGQHTAANLIQFNALEQSPEVALSKALVALALNDLEEDRPNHCLREDLQ
jgi:hypothetical protein